LYFGCRRVQHGRVDSHDCTVLYCVLMNFVLQFQCDFLYFVPVHCASACYQSLIDLGSQAKSQMINRETSTGRSVDPRTPVKAAPDDITVSGRGTTVQFLEGIVLSTAHEVPLPPHMPQRSSSFLEPTTASQPCTRANVHSAQEFTAAGAVPLVGAPATLSVPRNRSASSHTLKPVSFNALSKVVEQ